MTQSDALTILKTGANVFLTGEPGSGKTHTLREYIKYLKEYGVDPVVTASTGIAATHIGGVTIHSWSGIGAKEYISEYEIDRIASTEHVAKRITKAKVLIIDEVSMLSGRTIYAIDNIIKSIKGSNEPFGGLQVVFVGDFFQLPPIKRNGEEDDFAFSSRSWRDAKVVVCYLSEQHRNQNSELFEILSAARNNNLKDVHFEMLSSRITKLDNLKNETKLFTHNKDVDILNKEKLEALPGKKHVFNMIHKGNPTMAASLARGCLSPEILDLKIGARVMCTKNNVARGFVNGTLGTIVSFGASGGYPIIKTLDGNEILVEPMTWQVEVDGKVKAEIFQVPLRLAWAITVHKSQGMTLSGAAIDLSHSFEYGQGYVALSRLTSLSGLELIGINNNSLKVHPTVLDMDDYFQTESSKSEAFLFSSSKAELDKLAEQFVIFCDGSLKKEKKPLEKKTTTHEATMNLLKQGLDVDAICRERNLKPDTVIDHLYVLHERGDITNGELISVVPPFLAKNLNKIYKAFDSCGEEKLSPVFEYLKGEYPYTDLKLCRILYNALYK